MASNWIYQAIKSLFHMHLKSVQVRLHYKKTCPLQSFATTLGEKSCLVINWMVLVAVFGQQSSDQISQVDNQNDLFYTFLATNRSVQVTTDGCSEQAFF